MLLSQCPSALGPSPVPATTGDDTMTMEPGSAVPDMKARWPQLWFDWRSRSTVAPRAGDGQAGLPAAPAFGSDAVLVWQHALAAGWQQLEQRHQW